MRKVECFKIRILSKREADFTFDARDKKPVLTINCLSEWFNLNPTIIVADPFLFVNGDRLFLFYESKRLFSHGVIMMTSTTDLEHWTRPRVVLEENFHLSYPWVLMEGGKVYMIPETSADGSIRIYEAEDQTLTRWKLLKRLIELPLGKILKMGFSDSSIYKKEGVYCLMTTVQHEDGMNCLELYYSDSLIGEYVKHPLSPIAHSQDVGRNAGSLQEINGKLYRFSQNCVLRYGDNVHISEVTELTTTGYQEHLVKENIYSSANSFYKEGGHHLNMLKFRGSWIIATDAKEYHQLLGIRIMHKLKNFFFL